MKVVVKVFGSKDEKEFEFPPSARVIALREKVSDQLVLPIDSFKMLLAGKPISDDAKSLTGSDLKEGSKVTVMINDKIDRPLDVVEEAIANGFGGGKTGTQAILRYQKCLEDLVNGVSLDEWERYAAGLAAQTTA